MRPMTIRALLALCAVLPMTHASARGDALAQAAPQALVVVGQSATPAERQAAEKLAAHLRRLGGPADNLVTDVAINRDLERAASHHLLVVGREDTNRVLQRVLSHWVLNRDWYYRDREPYEAYMPTTGYHAAGYGTFHQGDVGYIEWDRNPYYHYASNLPTDQRNSESRPIELPYRQIVRLTGNSPQGVSLAVDAAIQQSVLTGVIPAGGRLPGPMTLWSIDTDHYAPPEAAPGWIPRDELRRGERVVRFAGWHIADSMTYAGFEEVTGIAANRIWRAKYQTERNWDYPPHAVIDPAHPMTRSPLFEATMARRASGNELLVVELADAQKARQAASAAEKSLSDKKPSHTPWQDRTIGGLHWRRSRYDVHITTHGPYLIMESFGSEHDDLILEQLARNLAGSGQ